MANARQAARGRQSTGSGQANGNGSQPTAEQQKLAGAIAYEETIAQLAAEIRGEATKLTPELFLKLWPLARKSIPDGFIEKIGVKTGKPYESTGVRSLQVQINRMDNVFTPLHWGWRTDWLSDHLAEVTVWIGPEPIWQDGQAYGAGAAPLVVRRARGGVDRGTGTGNIAKGCETNAGKLAFARIGPGHEIYLGLGDFDPDTDESAAEAQGAGGATGQSSGEPRPLSADNVKNLQAQVHEAGLDEHLAAKLRSFGVEKIAELSFEQALALHEWTKGGESG